MDFFLFKYLTLINERGFSVLRKCEIRYFPAPDNVDIKNNCFPEYKPRYATTYGTPKICQTESHSAWLMEDFYTQLLKMVTSLNERWQQGVL